MHAAASPLLSPVRRAALLLALLTLAAYANSFQVFYLFDDSSAILENPTLRHLSSALTPLLDGSPVTGRPLVNLSFALNYALGGLAVGGYHATNLLIHLLATLALFGLLRRTLLLPGCSPGMPADATLIAAATTALWAVHPLQTEAVTYLSQRAESLMGLFYLLTLYAFLRGVTEDSRRWLFASVAACLAGVECKEVMISAPLFVLLYDRTLLSKSFSTALRTRSGYYTALAVTWLPLAAQMAHVGDRGGAVGTGLTLTAWDYARTQLSALALYLRLSFWPHPLVLDYGSILFTRTAEVLPSALLVAALLAATVFLLWKRSPFGLLGAWFFAILAPTSSVVPLVKQTIAEHRMYLPLAAVLLPVVLLLHRVLGAQRMIPVLLPLLLVSLVLTLQRNVDYLDGLRIWRQSLAFNPDNPRAHINLGTAEAAIGRPDLAASEFREALRLDPRLPEAHNNLGVVESALGHDAAARAEFRSAIRLLPGWNKPRESLARLEATAKKGAR